MSDVELVSVDTADVPGSVTGDDIAKLRSFIASGGRVFGSTLVKKLLNELESTRNQLQAERSRLAEMKRREPHINPDNGREIICGVCGEHALQVCIHIAAKLDGE